MVMRSLLFFVACLGATGLAGCSTQADDGSVTDDSNEIVQGRSFIEKELATPLAPPTPAMMGKSMNDVVTEATTGKAVGEKKNIGDGCTLQKFGDAATKKVVAEREVCKGTDILRLVDAEGAATTTWSDLNKDGKVDRFSGEDGAFVLYADADFDGKVDQTMERVDRIQDFSLKGYEETYPKSKFVHRIREDRNKDGKLDHEKYLSKGLLPPASAD
jgi:hypothetical protein